MGFIHEKLDIKILLLFILQRLPDMVTANELSQFALIDAGINYFDYIECLDELTRTGHVVSTEAGYSITEKGINHISVVESTLPYSVRAKTGRSVAVLADAMRRRAMIETSHEDLPDGSALVKLSLSDGRGAVLSMSLLTSGAEQAERMEKNFRDDAENLYISIARLLSDPDD